MAKTAKKTPKKSPKKVKVKAKMPNRVGTFRHLDDHAILTVAANLRRTRTEQGLSLIKLSEKTDPPMSFITISKLENGHAEPRLVSLVNLARALKVKPAEFLDGL